MLIRFQVMDILGAVGNMECHEAAREIAGVNNQLLERYLWALAQNPNPDDDVAEGKITL